MPEFRVAFYSVDDNIKWLTWDKIQAPSFITAALEFYENEDSGDDEGFVHVAVLSECARALYLIGHKPRTIEQITFEPKGWLQLGITFDEAHDDW